MRKGTLPCPASLATVVGELCEARNLGIAMGLKDGFSTAIHEDLFSGDLLKSFRFFFSLASKLEQCAYAIWYICASD